MKTAGPNLKPWFPVGVVLFVQAGAAVLLILAICNLASLLMAWAGGGRRAPSHPARKLVPARRATKLDVQTVLTSA